MPKKPDIKQTSRSVITLRFDDISVGWEYWVLLGTDVHHDSPWCRRELRHKHLDMVMEREGLAIECGDTFDAMSGKYDPRRSFSGVRPEDMVDDYMDSIVKHAVKDYAKYADHFVLFSLGNHCTTLIKNGNTNPINRLVSGLNHKTSDGHQIYSGLYAGSVRFMFTVNGTRRSSFNMKYNHGSGTNSPVTRGSIQTNRQAVFIPDADIVYNGHNHQAYIIPIARERMTPTGKVKKDLVYFIRTPGYKDEWGDGAEGYAVERGMGPTPNGACWLRFYLEDQAVKVQPILEIE